MELKVMAPGKQNSEKVKLDDKIFAREFNEALVHQVVTAYLAGARAGTSAQKTRSEVKGGGKKPWRQKGTGRARAGTIRSPIFRTGGVTFASKQRDYTQKVNKKMYRAALQTILSELIRKERFIITDEFKVTEPKTKQIIAMLKNYNVSDALIILDEIEANVFRAANNIPNIEVIDVQGITPVNLIDFENVIVTTAALKQIEDFLK